MQKISSYFITIVLLLLSINGFSQATTNSPYSSFGIGTLRSESFNQNFGLAGAGIGLRSLNNINTINPASYSQLSITSFEISATTNSLWITDGKQSQYKNNNYINYIAFGFPVITNKWGMAFGAMPYSHVGYDYSTIKTDSIAGNVSYYYLGQGGTTKIFFGNALKFKLDSTSTISLGYNLGFLFGNISTDKKVIFGDISNAANVWDIKGSHIAGFTSDFGMQYQKTFTNTNDKKYILTIGATFALAADLKTKSSRNLRTFTGNLEFGLVKDTILFVDDERSVTSFPAKIGGGIALEKDKKWTIVLDFKTTNWGAILSSDNNIAYKNNYTIITGFELVPKYDAFNNYFKRIRYKIGARYTTAYYSINNTDINEYGITFGLSLPIKRTDTAIPGLNLGIEYGNRGVATNGLVKETFVNFNLGLTINDRWFVKRKYD